MCSILFSSLPVFLHPLYSSLYHQWSVCTSVGSLCTLCMLCTYTLLYILVPISVSLSFPPYPSTSLYAPLCPFVPLSAPSTAPQCPSVCPLHSFTPVSVPFYTPQWPLCTLPTPSTPFCASPCPSVPLCTHPCSRLYSPYQSVPLHFSSTLSILNGQGSPLQPIRLFGSN